MLLSRIFTWLDTLTPNSGEEARVRDRSVRARSRIPYQIASPSQLTSSTQTSLMTNLKMFFSLQPIIFTGTGVIAFPTLKFFTGTLAFATHSAIAALLIWTSPCEDGKPRKIAYGLTW